VPKRIVICCDGTWNTPDEVDDLGEPISTNVTKLAFAVKDQDDKGVEQRTFYGRGVGTAAFDHLVGGAFGLGLSAKIQDAYLFLAENFDLGDELFIFGFSRGAYTARSLAGFIRNSGILRRQYLNRLNAAFALYRDRDPATHPRSREATLFRRTYSSETNIKFIGVWDTVGALGVPDVPIPAPISNLWKFHDVMLSRYVDFAYHALALDERRKSFVPTLWDQDDTAPSSQVLRQVWFTGVHSDIGGGYSESGLSDIPLRWLMSRAERCGLALDEAAIPSGVHPNLCGPLHRSLTSFYRVLGETTRRIPEQRLRSNGTPMNTNEWVASTAQKRWEMDPSYRPSNLGEYLWRRGRIKEIPG
jgi:uncharacterized protein (DUF2235 family)